MASANGLRLYSLTVAATVSKSSRKSISRIRSAFTYYTGFKVNSGEYKLMGLAPYGEPRFVQLIFDHLIDVKPDGSFHLNLDYFNYCAGLTMTNSRFHRLFGLA